MAKTQILKAPPEPIGIRQDKHQNKIQNPKSPIEPIEFRQILKEIKNTIDLPSASLSWNPNTRSGCHGIGVRQKEIEPVATLHPRGASLPRAKREHARDSTLQINNHPYTLATHILSSSHLDNTQIPHFDLETTKTHLFRISFLESTQLGVRQKVVRRIPTAPTTTPLFNPYTVRKSEELRSHAQSANTKYQSSLTHHHTFSSFL